MTLYSAYNATLPSVKGKVFVVTGTTSGTGYVAARTAAEHGGEVLLLNRSSSRAEDSLERLQKEVPGGTFVPFDCDLQNFASVRKAAAEIKKKYSKLYCLGNNAGIMAAPDRATKDGYDVQMQTNHLSHFLLTSELYPLLEAEARENGDARIVNHSSGARLMTPNRTLEAKYLEKNGGNLGGDELGFMKGPCFVRYFHSKLANSVFTYGLHEQLKAAGSSVRAIAAHPGISNTNLSDNLDFGWWKTLLFKAATPFIAQSSEDGALGFIKGMMDSEAESGVLYGPKLKSMKGPAVPNPPKTFEIDPEAIKMLWELSNKAVGTEFRISKL